MMEFVMLGVTLTVALVVATLLSTLIAYKIMMSPKVWEKMFKQTMNLMEKLNEMEEKSLEKGDL
ncbi:MAG: hypothetical protein J6B01_04565 [Ruminococcus sp.]|nr:hypothetical protein [Ruminococcus sp.]